MHSTIHSKSLLAVAMEE